MSKIEKIAALKLQNPVLTKQINGESVELDAAEYLETIEAWADAMIAKEAAQAAKDSKAESDAIAKAALLERLGITADEATLLLS
jgi:hypothetical protein